MNIKAFPALQIVERPDVLREKHVYGMWYGVAAGLAYSAFCWGFDSYLLSMYHGMLPWMKFGLGAMLCMIPGGVTGWYAAKFNKPAIALLLWLAYAVLLAGLTVCLPFAIMPKVIEILQPQTSELLHYTWYGSFNLQIVVAFLWLSIFSSLAGLLQIPLSDSGVFSVTWVGRVGPMFMAALLLGLGSTILDRWLVNQPLRSSLVSTDSTIQFVIDHRGREVNQIEALQMHAGAMRSVDDSLTQSRELIVSGYDSLLGEVNVLVKFEHDWVECIVLYEQPSLCKVVGQVESE